MALAPIEVVNIDVRIFRMRDGRWRARVEWGSKRVYTREYDHRISLLLAVNDLISEVKVA